MQWFPRQHILDLALDHDRGVGDELRFQYHQRLARIEEEEAREAAAVAEEQRLQQEEEALIQEEARAAAAVAEAQRLQQEEEARAAAEAAAAALAGPPAAGGKPKPKLYSVEAQEAARLENFKARPTSEGMRKISTDLRRSRRKEEQREKARKEAAKKQESDDDDLDVPIGDMVAMIKEGEQLLEETSNNSGEGDHDPDL